MKCRAVIYQNATYQISKSHLLKAAAHYSCLWLTFFQAGELASKQSSRLQSPFILIFCWVNLRSRSILENKVKSGCVCGGGRGEVREIKGTKGIVCRYIYVPGCLVIVKRQQKVLPNKKNMKNCTSLLRIKNEKKPALLEMNGNNFFTVFLFFCSFKFYTLFSF